MNNKKQDTAKTRVREFFVKSGIRFMDAERKCGFNQGYFSRGEAMDTYKLAEIARNYPEIDLYWIITGERKETVRSILPEVNANALDMPYKAAYEGAVMQIDALRAIIKELEKNK